MKIFNLLNKISSTLAERKHEKRILCQTKFLTFVELLLVLAIIGIITGLILPPILRSRNSAKFTSWLNYNNQLNQKPDTVINFNFQESGYKLNIDGIMTPCIENSANACSFKGFDIKEYAGIMVNNPEWLPHGGRCYEKGAMQFNGSDQCLYIPGIDALDFLQNKDDFTIYLWIYYYSTPRGTVFTKGEEGGRQQYKMSMYNSRPQVIVGQKELRCEKKIYEKKWYHIAVVNKADSGFKIFVNGEVQKTKNIKSKLEADFQNAKSLTIGASPKSRTRNIFNSRTGKTEKENYYSLTACFRGKIDEIVILRRAMPAKEINNVYKIGKVAQH